MSFQLPLPESGREWAEGLDDTTLRSINRDYIKGDHSPEAIDAHDEYLRRRAAGTLTKKRKSLRPSSWAFPYRCPKHQTARYTGNCKECRELNRDPGVVPNRPDPPQG